MLGTVLVQAAWILSVPAFRGIDEFDHAYRAAAVAGGEWWSSEPAPDGRGELVTVPRDLVVAAGPECKSRAYTGHDNCAPVADAVGDPVQVATAAARYQPLFYWAVGEAARVFHGTSALYAMRVAASLMCAALVALAGWSVSLWARTRWPMVALLAALTPVTLYSSTTAAPNGIEILAGLAVWVTLAGLSTAGLGQRAERALLWASVPGAMILATVRSLGIGWLVLIVTSCMILAGTGRCREIARRQRGTLVSWGALVGLAVVGALAWLVTAAPNQLEEHADNPGALAGSLIQVPVWILQSVATGVGRANPAPGLVYLACGGVLALLVTMGLRAARTRLRRLMLAVALSAVAGPLVLTLLTYRDVGVVWQGRYGLAFSVGLIILAGVSLDQAGPVGPQVRPWVLVALLVYAGGHALAAVAVLDGQLEESPSLALGLWHPPSAALVVALILAGWAAFAAALLATRERRTG